LVLTPPINKIVLITKISNMLYLDLKKYAKLFYSIIFSAVIIQWLIVASNLIGNEKERGSIVYQTRNLLEIIQILTGTFRLDIWVANLLTWLSEKTR